MMVTILVGSRRYGFDPEVEVLVALPPTEKQPGDDK